MTIRQMDYIMLIISDGEGERKSEKEFDRTVYWKKFGKNKSDLAMKYRKVPKFSDTKIFSVIYLKFK